MTTIAPTPYSLNLNDKGYKQDPAITTQEIPPPEAETSSVDPDDTLVEATTGLEIASKDSVEVSAYPPDGPRHPLPSTGRLFDDIFRHVTCQDQYVRDVKRLIDAFRQIKADNKKQEIQIQRLTRENTELHADLDDVREERRKLRIAYKQELAAHRRTQTQLAESQKKLAELELQYKAKVQEWQQAVRDLDDARQEIKELTREVTHLAARIRDLEHKLKIANEGEDAALRQLTNLQRYVFDLETRRADIEHQKDLNEAHVRQLEDEVADLKHRLARKRRSGGSWDVLQAEDEPVQIEEAADDLVTTDSNEVVEVQPQN